MPKSKAAKAERALLALYGAGGEFLADYPWEWEEDRWTELVVSLLIEAANVGPELARSAANALGELNALDASDLAAAGPEQRKFLKQILIQLGIDDQTGEEFVSQLCRVAAKVDKQWGGRIQRFLRQHGKLMARDLAALLASEGLENEKAMKVATLWLQNVANLPLILVNDPHVQSFCKRFELSVEELEAAADRLGVNLAVLDDLLALDHGRSIAASVGRQKAPHTKTTRDAASIS